MSSTIQQLEETLRKIDQLRTIVACNEHQIHALEEEAARLLEEIQKSDRYRRWRMLTIIGMPLVEI
jgi:uncharacterized membrane protein YjjP (DUF1212 family)